MGIGAGIVELYRLLAKEKFFDSVENVLEFGSQNLVCSGHARSYNALLTQLGRGVDSIDNLEKFLATSPPARELYQKLEIEYASIDTNGMHDSIFLDLNYDQLPAEFHKKYDMVTNYGTMEHLFNQLNGFKICHDAVKSGGHIFHLLPFLGYLDHGFFSYHPNFIYALAAANGYSIEGMWVNLHPLQDEVLIPYTPDLIKRIRLDFDTAVSLIVLFKKNSELSFEIPYQPVYSYSLMDYSEQKYRFVVDGTKMTAADYLPRQVPTSIVDRNVGALSGWLLLKEVFRRIKRRLGLPH